MTTPTYLGSASSQGASAASYGGGAQSVDVTYTLADLTSGAIDARYAVLVAGSDIVEPVATTAPTITTTAGWALLAEHSRDVESGSDRRRTLVKVLGAPLSAFPLTVTWDFVNTDFTGRFNSFVAGYSAASPVSITASDLDGTGSTTTSATLGTPARTATIIQVTLTTAGTNPTINTANSFTSRRVDGGSPSFILLDQQDIAAATDYATINTGSSTATWITVGCALSEERAWTRGRSWGPA